MSDTNAKGKDWPKGYKGVTVKMVNQDHEMQYTKASMPQKPPRSPDWEKKEKQ